MVSGFPDASDVNTLVFYPGYKTYNVERAFVFTIETPWAPVKANKWVVGSFCVVGVNSIQSLQSPTELSSNLHYWQVLLRVRIGWLSSRKSHFHFVRLLF